MTTATHTDLSNFAISENLVDDTALCVTCERTSATELEPVLPEASGRSAFAQALKIADSAKNRNHCDLSGAVALATLVGMGAAVVVFTGLFAASFYTSLLRFTEMDIVRMFGM
jgi:hypothetical protein